MNLPLLSKTKVNPFAWVVWCFGTLFYFYEFFLQVSPSVMVPELTEAFHVSAAQLGNLSAFYFYAYALMQIPVGLLLDRLGPRKLLSVAAIICMAGCFLFGITTSLSVASLARLLIGLGSSFAVVSCLKLAANWFPLNRFALLTGVLITMGMLGAACGQAPMAAMVNHFGWRQSMIIMGIIGGILAIVLWIVIKDKPIVSPNPDLPEPKPRYFSDIFHDLKQVLLNKQNWLVASYGCLMFAPTVALGALWGVSYLQIAEHISRAQAGFVVAFLFFGWAAGSPLGGYISDKMGRRKPTMWAAGIGSLILILIFLYVSISPTMAAVLLFLFGFFSSGFLPAFSIIREINPQETNATALGYMNGINMVGGALAQPFIGYILDLTNSATRTPGQLLHAYQIALSVIPGIIVLAMVFLPFIKETYCRIQEQKTVV